MTSNLGHDLPPHYQTGNIQHGHHRRHPRVTGYRLLVISLTAGFGLSEAKLSYEGYSTVPNTLDWIYGVLAFLLPQDAKLILYFGFDSFFDLLLQHIGVGRLYWLGIYERHAVHNMPWLFDIDYAALAWRLMVILCRQFGERNEREN